MIILASTSPRRIELLESTGILFKTAKPLFDEDTVSTQNIKVEEYTMYLAKQKALSLKSTYPDDIILAADTIVALNNEILNKPIDEKDAFRMLRKLSNKKHLVLTGVCIIKGEDIEVFYSQAEVEFIEISDQEIFDYIKTGEPMDKAGAYAIQGIGSKFVKKYKGDFHTIMGLPLKEVMTKIK